MSTKLLTPKKKQTRIKQVRIKPYNKKRTTKEANVATKINAIISESTAEHKKIIKALMTMEKKFDIILNNQIEYLNS